MKYFLPLITGLLILTYFVFSYFDPVKNPVGLGSDGSQYWHLSSNLLEKHQFCYSKLEVYPIVDLKSLSRAIHLPSIIPCTTRFPVYPVVLWAFRCLWDSPWIAIIVNYLCFIGICIYGFLLGNLFFTDSRSRWIYNTFLVLSPVYYVLWGIETEFCAAFFLTVFTYHIIKNISCKSPRSYHFVFAALGGVLASLTRPNLIIYTAALTLAVFILGVLKKNKTIIKHALIILILLILSMGLWMLRNKFLTDQWTLSAQGGYNLYHNHLGYGTGFPTKLFIENLQKGRTFNQTEGIVDNELMGITLKYEIQHPYHFIKKTVDGLRSLFLFSYFDISDAIVLSQSSWDKRLADPVVTTANGMTTQS